MLISCLKMYRRVFCTYLVNSYRFSPRLFSPRLRPECQSSTPATWNCQLSTVSGEVVSGNRSAAAAASQLRKVDVAKAVESLGDKFKDSMDLLEDAKSSLGTVYFSDDMNDAEQSVEETLLDFQHLLDRIDVEERAPVGRNMEPKMNELKMQLHILKESAKTLKMRKH